MPFGAVSEFGGLRNSVAAASILATAEGRLLGQLNGPAH